MNDPLSNLESMVAASLANQQGPTAEGIRELIDPTCASCRCLMVLSQRRTRRGSLSDSRSE